MQPIKSWIPFCGLIKKEWVRIIRLWTQSIVAPAVTATLYFMVFGHILGTQIGTTGGVSYLLYITPGLILMPSVTQPFTNAVGSLYLSRFTRSIEEVLMSPTPLWVLILAITSASVIRGFIASTTVLIIASIFTHVPIHHPILLITLISLSAALFSAVGLINAIFANSFDQTMMLVTFIITPLIYLSGVFFDIAKLQGVFKTISLYNPLYYLISAIRYASLNIPAPHLVNAIFALLALTLALLTIAWQLLERGVNIKS